MIDLDRIQRKITEQFGLMPRENWRAELQEGLDRLAAEASVTHSQLVHRLEVDGASLRDLAGHLGIQESYFLRQPEHFDFLVRHAEEQLVRHGGDDRRYSVWSAGCGRGEELYSAAIVVDYHLGSHLRGRIDLLGTDLNRAAIDVAKSATYTPWSFRGSPDWFVSRYFETATSMERSLAECIRCSARFVQLGILEHLQFLAPRSLDAIFFRNVAVYLHPRAVEQFYCGFESVLRKDGILIVAPTDPQPPGDKFVVVGETGSGMYRHREVPSSTMRGAGAASSARLPAATRQRAEAQVARGVSLAPACNDWEREALRLADEGKLDAAISVATRAIERAPGSKTGYQLRGQIRLSALQHDHAVEDLRRAVFIDPNDLIARYWYAIALASAGRTGQCLGQLRELIRRARCVSSGAVLEDRTTTVEQLLRTAFAMQESLS